MAVIEKTFMKGEKTMSKKLKKGFTLAELLIVVAIIAVLTAIAVPLFVTSLDKAEKATKAANIRSLRAAAVTYILTMEEGNDYYTICYNNGVLDVSDDGFYVTATLSNGDFSNFVIAKGSGSGQTEDYDKTSGVTSCMRIH